MSPEVFRVVGILVHSCAVARILCCNAPDPLTVIDVQTLRGEARGDALRYAWALLKTAWNKLCRLVFGEEQSEASGAMRTRAGNEEGVCALLHLIIDNVAAKGVPAAATTPAERQVWEVSHLRISGLPVFLSVGCVHEL
jgi:hypothetical protein